jgi:hypothetical protein
MLARFPLFRVADRRDVLLFTVLGLAVIGFSVVWALFLANLPIPLIGQNGFLFLAVIAFSVLAAVIPFFTWGRSETRPVARALVRFGLALQIFGILITPVGLYYATNPVVSVPVGFASFLTVFFGVFIAGFAGNLIAPPRV